MDYLLSKTTVEGCAVEHEHNLITFYNGHFDHPLTVAVERYDIGVMLNVIGQRRLGINDNLKYIVIHQKYDGAHTVEFYFENNLWVK